jgi:hypothetical protein
MLQPRGLVPPAQDPVRPYEVIEQRPPAPMSQARRAFAAEERDHRLGGQVIPVGLARG